MPDRRPPNILLITTDQQRYDTLGITGNPVVRTPNLDALARRGTLFRRGYIQNPVCVPSRACIETGRYVHQHGVEYMRNEVGETPGLPPWETTVMDRLRDAGYHTAAFGKIHMLPPRGFDEMDLTMGKGARWTVSSGSPLGPSQLGPNYASWLEKRRPGGYEEIYAQRRLPEYREQATAQVNVLAADECVDYWIAENTWNYLDREHDQPFFLWCGFCGPHGPFDPPEPYASMYPQDEIPLPALLKKRQSGVASDNRESRFDLPGGEDLMRKIIAYYWGMVSYVDDLIGRIADVMTKRGLWEDTLVIFTTDHGEMLGDFGRMGKGTMIESVIRVPYIMVPPAAAGGRAVDDLVEHVDIVPTIMDYAGLPAAEELLGQSLRPYLEEGTVARGRREAVLCEYTANDRQHRSKCLRSDRYKYVFHSDAPAEFYDLDDDPDELVNVADEPRYALEVRRHAEMLLGRLTDGILSGWNTTGSASAEHDVDHFGRSKISTQQEDA
jgi:arylsulfatase A-like enzyme